MTRRDQRTWPRADAADQPGGGGQPLWWISTEERCRATPPAAPPEAQTIPILPAGLAALRAAVARRAQRAGLPPERRDDLVLAVNELATNSIRHGGGSGTLEIWETADALICQVTDAGHLTDPRAGRMLPEPGEVGRYGLWLVNQLCDRVEQRTLPDGNLVRVSMGRGLRAA